MGQGFIYNCENCDCYMPVMLGVGMMFPQYCDELLSEIKAGKYGEEWKEAAIANNKAVVNGESKVYLCPICGNWEVLDDISLYAPYDESTEREPYATSHELDEDFYIVKKFEPSCEKCDNTMIAMDDKELSAEELDTNVKLKCPVCGTVNQISNMAVDWD